MLPELEEEVQDIFPQEHYQREWSLSKWVAEVMDLPVVGVEKE